MGCVVRTDTVDEGSAAASRKFCFWGIYFLKYVCVVTVLVCGHTVERIYMLGATNTYAIGLALLTISALIRLAVRRMLDNAMAESDSPTSSSVQ